jgi:alpha,alpha-trehalase
VTSSATESPTSELYRLISLDDADGWIFDLDGVLTDTASLHEQAWTELFQQLFDSMPSASPVAFTGDDYRRLVDGEDRMDGVRNVLVDRQIALPEGTPDDPVGTQSVFGLAKDKDNRYLALLADKGPRPFPSSVELLRRLRALGVSVAVVSASRHCAQVLEAAALTTLVDVRVDGYVAQAMGLAGKPDPALFLEAAHRLRVEPSRSVVLEDAIAGVEAGRRGGFGLVVGVDRNLQADALRQAGADIVVADLGELVLTGSGSLKTRSGRSPGCPPTADR